MVRGIEDVPDGEVDMAFCTAREVKMSSVCQKRVEQKKMNMVVWGTLGEIIEVVTRKNLSKLWNREYFQVVFRNQRE
jgi:hypothetical protein